LTLAAPRACVRNVEFALDPSLDVDDAARAYRSEGHVQIAPFLAAGCAEALRDHLIARAEWQRDLQLPGRQRRQFSAAELAELSPAQVEALRKLAAPNEAKGFRFCYESIGIVDHQGRRLDPDTLLDAFAAFLSSPDTVAVLRRIVGEERVAYADAFASRYAPGDFLSIHQDTHEGVARIAAYAFGLTREWRPEWGGLLLFHDERGDVARGLVPRWNALNLFAVPVDHSVSEVARFAPAPRLSITGWLYPALG
jgi:SM-20-related protein